MSSPTTPLDAAPFARKDHLEELRVFSGERKRGWGVGVFRRIHSCNLEATILTWNAIVSNSVVIPGETYDEKWGLEVCCFGSRV